MCIRIFNPFDIDSRHDKANNEPKRCENFNYYQCFLALYKEMMLDCDPLLRISESKVNNMVRKEIKKFKLSDHSYKIFHDFVLSENRFNVNLIIYFIQQHIHLIFIVYQVKAYRHQVTIK